MFSSGSQLLCLEKQRAGLVSSIQVGCQGRSHSPAGSKGHCGRGSPPRPRKSLKLVSIPASNPQANCHLKPQQATKGLDSLHCEENKPQLSSDIMSSHKGLEHKIAPSHLRIIALKNVQYSTEAHSLVYRLMDQTEVLVYTKLEHTTELHF